jgi:hypothetical protein
MASGPFTRYFCPLECGWHYDDPGPGPEDVTATSVQPGETFHDTVSRLAGTAALAHAGKLDAAFAEHLDTHTLMQAVAKAAEFRNERDQARAAVTRVQKYAESRCTEEHANFASASWVLHLIEVDQPADRTTEK